MSLKNLKTGIELLISMKIKAGFQNSTFKRCLRNYDKSSERILKFQIILKVLAFAKMNFILKLEKCRKRWCKVASDKIKGWVPKEVYGVLND